MQNRNKVERRILEFKLSKRVIYKHLERNTNCIPEGGRGAKGLKKNHKPMKRQHLDSDKTQKGEFDWQTGRRETNSSAHNYVQAEMWKTNNNNEKQTVGNGFRIVRS